MNRRLFLSRTFSLLGAYFLKVNCEYSMPHNKHSEISHKFKFWEQKFGFNLQNFFMVHSKRSVEEPEIKLIKELGFNFIRFPMDYRCWTNPNNLYQINESTLEEIDKGINICLKYGVHVCLNFHRAPGWTVAKPDEPLSLWKDGEAVKACAFHWKLFAERYKHISKDYLSYNLLNEPPGIPEDVHRRVVGNLIEEIRKVDSKKYILCNGRMWGTLPPFELTDFGIVASFHMYHPFTITHYKAEWAGNWENVPIPTYPLKEKNLIWDKDTIEEKHILPWIDLQEKGIPIFVGEFGAYNKTPHDVVIRWMKDCLDIFKKYHWGWALWNFKGPFGPINSGRPDVSYEKLGEDLVDIEMLDLLKKFIPPRSNC